MEPTTDTHWQRALAQLAAQVEYPPTPNIAARARDGVTGRQMLPAARPARPAGRRLAWALGVMALLALSLLAVPATRAALLSFFARVGAIEIFIDESAPTVPAPTLPASTLPASTLPASTLPASTPAASGQPATTTPVAVPHSLSLIDLGEPATLAEAERQAHFTPELPATLGAPDEAYTHPGVDLPAITLVWRPDDGPPLSLTAIAVAEFARKVVAATTVEEVAVGDETGLWLIGPHHLQLFGDWQGPNNLLITSNVLIWVHRGITYRLEGDLSQADAVAIAASLGD